MRGHRRRGLSLLAGVSFAALCASPALAQPQAAAASAPKATAGELVVTARRREERLQDVPQAVTSLSGQTLAAAGVTDTNAIAQVTPSLNMPHSGTNVQPMIRGVGTTNSSLGDEPNVAIYIDGVYQAEAAANSFMLSNIERVEVLKGPQGTLFGRNSEGGAINIITARPSEAPGGHASVSYGNHNHLTTDFYATGGLAPHLAASISIGYERGEGYSHDIYRDVSVGRWENLIIRPRVRVELPGDAAFTVDMLYDYINDPRGNVYSILNGNVSSRSLPAGAGLPVPSEPHEVALNFSPKNSIWQYQVSGKLEKDFGAFSASSQTSFTRNVGHNTNDADYGPVNLSLSSPFQILDTYQQEFLLNSLGHSRLSWTGGLFLYRGQSGYRPRTVGSSATGLTPFAITRQYTRMETTSYAPFGEATFEATDRLSITAGARYTYERKTVNGYTNTTIPAPGVSDAAHWSDFTPRVVVAYKAPDVVNLYASYSKGFKSGTYNQTALSPLQPVAPEKLTAYEIGAKTLVRGPWRASVAAFYNKYQNIQVLAYQFPISVLLNAARGKTYGFEAEGDATLFEGFRANAFVSYTHARYDSFPNAVINVPKPTGGNTQLNNVDESGQRFLRAPTWLAGVGFSYVRPTAAGRFEISGNYAYNSGFNWEITGRNHQPAYSLVNASLSWSPNDSNVKLTLWGTNLTNEDYSISGNSSANGDNIVYGPPRMYGVRVSTEF